jgi:ubiquinone/menaquinone biosynthesis C-methylase UbiE
MIVALRNPKPGEHRGLGQCRKPSGWLGRFVIWMMNRGHSRLTDWGLAHVAVRPTDLVLDLGCGGGSTVAKLAALAAEGRVCGVDHSETSVAAARRLNRRWIEIGRVEIREASVSALPYADATFDLATAVESHFWWPDLFHDMRETWRVLKPGGRVLLVAEFYKGGRHGKHAARVSAATGMAALTVDEHRELLARAGFETVEVVEEARRGWICASGRKPA